MMAKKTKISITHSIIVVLAFSLFACTSSTNTPSPTPTTPPPSPTPTVSTPRWMEYETALVEAILWEEGFCEWEILGQSGQEVYVWALCEIRSSEAGGSGPAVIYLAPDGKIENVVIPRDGVDYGGDIQKLFPPDIQPLVTSHSSVEGNQFVQQAMEHIAQRREDPSIPPMIVDEDTPLP